jgi:hypothetical protein
MKPEPRQVHMGNGRGGVKCRQNIAQLAGMFRVNAGRIILLKQLFQPLMPYRPDHAVP